MKAPFRDKSLILAPMEGITDEAYRLSVEEAFPDWSYYNTDFLRIPSSGFYSPKKIITHFGEIAYRKEKIKNKTGYQILTAINAYTKEHVEMIESHGFQHLDLNLGCPSKKVNGHRGGAYLLKDLPALEKIVATIRSNYKGFFSAKIRVGFDDDKNFNDIIKLLEYGGVEAITIHGRTRAQQYLGRANWDYIKRAVQNTNIPIIGNGDIWTVKDINDIFDHTDCYAVMAGRSAMKTPWLATLWQQYIERGSDLPDEVILGQRKENLEYFFHILEKHYRRAGLDSGKILKRFKALSRYTYEDYEKKDEIKSRLLRSDSLDRYKELLNQI
jgi:tRNA-dihydrouridine synthase B